MKLEGDSVVYVKPCVWPDHANPLRGTPTCFSGYGGHYKVIHHVLGGMWLLEHVGSHHMGLVDQNFIID